MLVRKVHKDAIISAQIDSILHILSGNNVSHYLSKAEHPARIAVLLISLVPLAACGTKNTADTYSQSAVQRASKVEPGVLIGIRKVVITADTSSGSQGTAAIGALVPFGGAVAGGIINSAVAQGARDYSGYEYIVRKPSGDMVSVTQADKVPLRIGEHVLIIEGPQARIVTDYTVPIPEEKKEEAATEKMPPPTPPKVEEKKPEAEPKSDELSRTPDAAHGVIAPESPVGQPSASDAPQAATPPATPVALPQAADPQAVEPKAVEPETKTEPAGTPSSPAASDMPTAQ